MKINRFGEYVVCKTFFIVLILFHSTNNLISLFYTPIRANNSPYPRPDFAHNVYKRKFMIKNALGKYLVCRVHNPFYGTVITSIRINMSVSPQPFIVKRQANFYLCLFLYLIFVVIDHYYNVSLVCLDNKTCGTYFFERSAVYGNGVVFGFVRV